MKNQIKKTICTALVFMGAFINAQFSEFGSAVFVQKNGTSAFYNLSGSGVNLIGSSSFSGDLGSFTSGTGTLSIKGAEIKTWKEYTSNVCGASLNYLVYKENQRPATPIFSTINLPWRENCSGYSFPSGGPCSNQRDQKWGIYDQNIDLTNFSPGIYTLEVYITFFGSATTGNGCESTYYVGNYGNNYKMSFTVAAAVGVNTSGNAFSSAENYIYSRTYLEAVTYSSTTAKQIQGITYFDGLGRPKQSIAIKSTPMGNDMVTPVEYDAFGRQIKDWLPLPQLSTGNGAINTAPDTSFYSSFTGANLYAEKKLELSPLDRLQELGHPGAEWKIGSAHSQKFEYDTNAVGEVKKYIATFDYSTFTSSISLSGEYGAGQLYKNKVTDEDGNVSYEFKNGKGQTLLVRKNDGTNNADNYYVYNEYDQLAYVLPPLASASTVSSTVLDNLCYQYKYDDQNRLVEKKLPGKGWEYMVYDQADRLVLTQDANMRASGRWLLTKYDAFNRVAYTAMMPGGDRNNMQSQIINLSITENRNTTGFSMSGITVYYTNQYFTNLDTVLSVNYYDTYPADMIIALPASIQGQTTLSAAIVNNRSVKSMPTASYVKNIEDNNWTRSYTFYDTKARAIGSYSKNHLGGYTKTESVLDFAGTPLNTYTYHRRLSSDTDKQIKERFVYDTQNRLLQHYHQVDTNPEELLTDNTYNEISQLKTKKVGGSTATPLQTVDYAYNIRGWMTSINNPANLGTDLFGYSIKYQNPANAFVAPARYNGNIAEIDWKTGTDGVLRRYGYQYDNLNRLLNATYQKPNAATPVTNAYNESLTYDINGNIISLNRFGGYDITTPIKIDQLAYTYNGNQVTRVIDNSKNYMGYPNAYINNTITYDANGNMKNQLDKQIRDIQYNFLNLPQKVIGSRDETNYIYRTDGSKVRKTYSYLIPNGYDFMTAVRVIDYIDGFQYMMEDTSGMICLDCPPVAPVLQFVPTAEGYYDFTKNAYIYNYVDHLGNVRVSYYKNSAGVLTVLEENNYYPFGLKHEGYNNLAGNPSYQYKYNGKELQETGMYDYGARFYMPDIGRWGVLDPLAEAYTKFSPYNYTLNNPIFFIDPNGTYVDTSEIYAKNKDGSYRNPNLVKAWNIFATSKEGINFLKDFVSAGQKIAGHEYKESGKFDKAGIDITFDNGKSVKEYNDTHIPEANGITTPKLMENGRLNFQVSVSNLPFTDQAIENISHEFAEHITPKALDFYDNKKFDFSKGYDALMDYKNGYTPQYYSKYYGDSKDKTSTTDLEHQMNDKTQSAEKLGVPIIQVLYQKNNIKRTDEQIKKILFSK